MTKLKNTKKGMAKKALSISLVAAMLATSNVPVWAAEDLFSDGSAAVEAPAVEEPAAEVDTFSAEPVEETTPAVETQASSTNDDHKVTLGPNLEALIKNGITWGGSTQYTATVDGIENGMTAYYTWKDSEGKAIVEAKSLDLKNTSANVTLDLSNGAQYAGKTLTLYIYIQQNNATIWEYTSDTFKVNAKNVGDCGYSITVQDSVEYDGEDNKLDITLNHTTEDVLKASDFTVNYEGENGNLVDVGTVNVTATVNKQGYTGTLTDTYQITPKTLNQNNISDYVDITLKNTSMPYTGENDYSIYSSDVTLTDKKTGEDVSYLLKEHPEANDRVGVLNGKDVNSKGTATIAIKALNDTNKNFKVESDFTTSTQNEMTIVARDLSTVTATAANYYISYTGNVINAGNLGQITYKDANGNTLTLSNDVDITVPANTSAVGTYEATVTPKSGNKNVTGTTKIKFQIVSSSVHNATFATSDGEAYAVKEETYTGKQITKDLVKLGEVKVGGTTLTSSEYEIKFGENVNAGEDAGKLYIVGKGSYEGTQKEYSFDINKAVVDELVYEDSVEYIAGGDATSYKDALGLKVTASGKTLALTEGTDYKVEYSFDDEQNIINNNNLKVKVTLINNNLVFSDNKTSKEFTVDITQIGLKDSYIVMNQSSYEYTGKTIEPDFDVVVNGRTISPENYTVSISNGVNAGTASFTVTAVAGNKVFADGTSAKGTYTITPANTDKLDVTIGAKAYTGYSITPVASELDVTFNGEEMDSSFITNNFILSYGENIDMGENAGTVTLTPKSGNTNFTGTKTVSFTISGTLLNGGSLKYYDENGLIIDQLSFEYDGKAYEPAETVYTGPNELTLTEGTDYEIQYVDNVYGKKNDDGYQYGAVLVIAKGTYAGNYTNATYGVKDGIYTTADGTKISSVAYAETFKIETLSITSKNVSVANGTYAAGFQVKPELTISVDGVILVEGKDYELKFDDSQDRTNVTNTKSLTVEVVGINGYRSNGTLKFNWGIDKFNLANADVSVNGETVTVKCGKVDIDASEYTVSAEGNTVTVTAKEDSKNYTGSKTIDIELEDEKPAAPVIESVNVNGNNATVVLAGESDGATGYDYVISTDRDCITTKDYDKVNKNMLTTETTFTYTEQGIYYAYCHSWKRVDGVKVFSDWSEAYPFSVTSITPEQPVITKLEKSSNGKHLRVTWTQCENATGYDVVMGTKLQKVNGEYRPTEYGKAVKKVTNGNTVSVIFYNIPSGTYYVGLHAYNRTSETGVKVFSPWSNSKEVKF